MNGGRLSPRDATIATVAYADVFDYPLTSGERTHWLLLGSHKAADVSEIENKGGYWFLKGHERIVALRKEREAWQEEKWVMAKKAAGYLSWIPTIQLVGVTGGLAMDNARREDDIDLFLVVSDGTLWVSRFMATLLMDILGLRRRPRETRVVNKICLNMFMTEGGLGVPFAERDCFSAHEVLQMRPLWEQKGTHQKFLAANAWARTYLPNAWKGKAVRGIPEAHRTPAVVVWLFRIFEASARALQLWYMARHRTHEVITDMALRFHPKDARVWVRRKLGARLKKYRIPLDKVFYAS